MKEEYVVIRANEALIPADPKRLLKEIYHRLNEMDWRTIEKAVDGYDEDLEHIRSWLKRVRAEGLDR